LFTLSGVEGFRISVFEFRIYIPGAVGGVDPPWSPSVGSVPGAGVGSDGGSVGSGACGVGSVGGIPKGGVGVFGSAGGGGGGVGVVDVSGIDPPVVGGGVCPGC
jgi:hypothetical protein